MRPLRAAAKNAGERELMAKSRFHSGDAGERELMELKLRFQPGDVVRLSLPGSKLHGTVGTLKAPRPPMGWWLVEARQALEHEDGSADPDRSFIAPDLWLELVERPVVESLLDLAIAVREAEALDEAEHGVQEGIRTPVSPPAPHVHSFGPKGRKRCACGEMP